MSLTTTLSAFLLVFANFALSAGASQEEGPRTTNDIHYRMSPVGDTQVRFPRLTAYKDITTMNRVNAQIDELSKEFGCPAPRGKDESYKVFSRVEYAAKDIITPLTPGPTSASKACASITGLKKRCPKVPTFQRPCCRSAALKSVCVKTIKGVWE